MLTGGVLRGIRSRYLLVYGLIYPSLRDDHSAGVSAILPGAMVVGTASTILQYGYNELSIMRLRYVLNLQRNTDAKGYGGRTTALNEVKEPAFRSLMKFFGVAPISDEDYLAKLRRSREVYLQQIAELEKRIEEERIIENPPTQKTRP